MSPVITTRWMTAADIDGVAHIAGRLEDAPQWPITAYAAALDPDSRPQRLALVAEAEGRGILGFLIASLVASEAELESVAVAAEFQRQGVARALLAVLRSELAARGVTELFLEVRVSNLPARAFYGLEGFAEIGRRQRYYRDPEEDAVLFRLALP